MNNVALYSFWKDLALNMIRIDKINKKSHKHDLLETERPSDVAVSPISFIFKVKMAVDDHTIGLGI